MRITRAGIETLVDAIGELESAAQEWLDITDDSESETEDKQDARAELEDQLGNIADILLTKIERKGFTIEEVEAQVTRDQASPR